MKKLIAFLFVCLCSVALAQQPEFKVEGKKISACTAKKQIKQGKVFLLTSGMPATRGLSDAALKCREDAQAEFGFKYYPVAGDVVDEKKLKKINQYNAVVQKHLAKKYGADWETKLSAKFEACNKL